MDAPADDFGAILGRIQGGMYGGGQSAIGLRPMIAFIQERSSFSFSISSMGRMTAVVGKPVIVPKASVADRAAFVLAQARGQA